MLAKARGLAVVSVMATLRGPMFKHISEATEPLLRGNAQGTTRDANVEVAGGWDGRVYGPTGGTARRLFPTRESRPETRLISRRATVPAP
jgi:hypothetical protein